jgi:anti-sigma B factor antagonist
MRTAAFNEVTGGVAVEPALPRLLPKAAVPGQSLEIDVERHGRVVVVRLRGSAGMVQAERLCNRLETLGAERPAITVLDLSQLDFIGSAGLGAILQGYLESRCYHGHVRLAAPQPRVRAVLERTRLVKLFDVYETVEQAMRA